MPDNLALDESGVAKCDIPRPFRHTCIMKKRFPSLKCAVFGLIGAGLYLIAGWVPILSAAESPLSVVIEGLSGKVLDNVNLALRLPPGIVENGKIDETLAGHFADQIPQKVREAMQPFGYYNPEIKVSREKNDGGLSILKVHVEAGAPVRLDNVQVSVSGSGAQEVMLQDMIRRFPLKKGDILRQDIYEQSKEDLLKKAGALGYLDATFATHQIGVSLQTLKADLTLKLETGPRYRFGKISFPGKPGYPEGFLRRYLDFKTGDIFSYEKMAKTQANYTNADRFRAIAVYPKKDAIAEGSVPVEVALTPSPSRNLRIGGGYGTDTGPRATLRYRDANMFERGQELEMELKASQILQGASARYIFPGMRDFQTYTALTTGAQQENTTSYVTKWIKVEAERVRAFGRDKIGSVFLQARKENSDAGDQSTNTFILMPGVRFSEMRYDDAIRPRKGFNYQLELRGTHQSIGSSTGFVQFLSGADVIVPLPASFSFITRARLGATWQNDPAQDLPVSVRFFAGGDRSVRGYAYQSLGPKDSKGNVVGGRNLLSGSVELERGIGKNWGAAAFYDAGNAFDNFSDISLAKGAGLGIRYYSPFGPIKLDVARQLDVVQPDTRIHLTIGVGL